MTSSVSSVAHRIGSILVAVSLMSASTPAAPKTIIALAEQSRVSFAFWYHSSGLAKAIQGRGAPNPRAQERQADRDAKVSRLEIHPSNVSVDLAERVRFVAVGYDGAGNAVGGVNVRWTAQGATAGQRARISRQGEFHPVAPGVFTVTAQAAGKSAQTTVTVRPGSRPNLNLPPTGTRQVSSRDVPTVRVGSNKQQQNAEKGSAKRSQRPAKAELAKRSHALKAASSIAPEPMPQSGGGSWDSTNYWSADDPGNRVGDPPGTTPDGGSGSGNFQFAAPIYSAPGRGINISLGLAYNSRVWNKANTQMSYDNDRGWPAPGFNLGFGKLLGMTINSGCMLVDPDGTRHSYSGNITFYSWGTYGVMHTTDGSFIDYTYWTGTNGVITWAQAKLPNGTVINYGAYSQAGGGVFPTSIEDANGNFIYITYVNNAGPRIQTVTDTLGRVINFHYDPNNLLTAVTAPGLDGGTRTLVRLHYRQLTLSYGFSWPEIQTTAVSNPAPWVVDAIYYPGTGTGYWLYDSYSSYGMLASVIEQRDMIFPPTTPLNEMGTVTQGSVTRREEYNYPMTPNYSLTDAPTYTTMTERWTPDGGTTLSEAVTGYEVYENANPRTTTITLPNGTKSKRYSYYAPGQWNDGLIYEDRTFTTDENNPLQKSTSSWQQGAYDSPRPTQVQKTDERGQTTTAQFIYGAVYNQVTEVRDLGYSGELLRSTRTTYQNSANYTGTCYSYGCYGRHIFNLPLSVEIYDGNNNRQTRTEYQYDGQPLTAAPNVVMHNQASNPHAEAEGFCHWETDWNDPDCNGSCWEPGWNNCDGQCNQIYICPYDASTDFRGNMTQVTSYADALNLTDAVTETRRYDVTGNLVKTSSACCEQTTFSYSLDYQYAYPQSQTRGSATDPYAQVTTSATYDFNTGLTRYARDANNRESETKYDSATLRVVRSISPTGAHTDYEYSDSSMSVTQRTFLEAHPNDATKADENVKYLNGRGQVRQEKALGANSVWDFVDTVYGNMGQVLKQSRPYRSGDALRWTETAYDVLGRPTTATAPDGSITQTSYNEPSRPDVASTAPGETTRVQDAWGRERWGRTDASGRLVEVVEPVFWGNGSVSAGMQTTYTYNTLGNLITINSMAGTQIQQTRSFKYDSLGRLTAQKLAEVSATLNDAGTYVGVGGPGAQWGEVFTYDNRSNLTSRTEARGVRTVYTYNNDPLNRLQSVAWDTSGFGDTSNPILPAATVNYSYRTKSSGAQLLDITQLASVTTAGVSTESYGFDPEGRISSKTLTLTSRPGYDFATDYMYDALDRVTDVLYPKQWGNGQQPRKMVHHDYDVASRLSSLTYGGQTQASNLVYNAASQTTSLSVGTGTNQVNEAYGYHAQTGLLENQTITRNGSTLLNLSYDYVGANGKRTGQLTKITNNLDPNKNRGYQYDALGRLITATGGPSNNVTWAQRYEYDRYGNRNNVYSYVLEDYVKNFYQSALNRQPNSTELNQWLTSLRAAYLQGQWEFHAEMRDLGSTLFTSSEYLGRNRTHSEFVYDLYKAFLYREPDQDGYAYWVSMVPVNGRDNVRLAFEVAPEFYTKVFGTSPYAPPAGVTIPLDGLQGIGYDQATNRIANTGWNYDAAGNQTRVQTSESAWQRYQYDAANRLVRVKDDNQTVIASYTYGHDNQRLIYEEAGTRIYYVAEGLSVIAEYSESGASTNPAWSKSYVYLGNRLLSTLTPYSSGGEAVEYHHPDRLGTRIVTNPASGSWSEQVTLPFGTALDAESSGTPSKRRFTTYDRSDTTKLDYAVNRHYDSQQGRFTQPDRIGMSDSDLSAPQSFNLYAYCMNDPVNHSDPSGLGFLSFLKKVGKAILKVLKSKWFQIALAVAIIVIAHYYPHSIFGALGGGSQAGGTAPILHGAGATTGLAGGAAGTAAANAAAAAYWSTFSVAALEGMGAVSAGIATAVSLGMAGALGAGLVANLGQTSQQSSNSKKNTQGKTRCPPTADQLAKNPKVIGALKEALKRGLERRLEHGGWIYWNRLTNRLFTIIKQPTVDPLNVSGEADRWDRVFLGHPPTPPAGTEIVGSFHVHLEAIGPSGDFDNWAADQFKTPGIHMTSAGRISTYGNYKRGIWNKGTPPGCK